MNKSRLLSAVCAIYFISMPSSAALIDRGGGLIYDDVLDVTWLQDANYAYTSGYHVDGQMLWPEATAWVDSLIYYDSVRDVTYDDWRLPSADVNDDGIVENCEPGGVAGCTDNEMNALFWNEGITSAAPGLFQNIQPGTYWTGTDAAYSPTTRAWIFRMYNGVQGTNIKISSPLRAWAVRDGDVVPIPASIWLFGSGLLGLVGMARRKKTP